MVDETSGGVAEKDPQVETPSSSGCAELELKEYVCSVKGCGNRFRLWSKKKPDPKKVKCRTMCGATDREYASYSHQYVTIPKGCENDLQWNEEESRWRSVPRISD